MLILMQTLHLSDYHLAKSSSSTPYGWALRPFHLDSSDSQHWLEEIVTNHCPVNMT